ncbi:MAG: ABC transporter ATP-binding protein [Treponema sp.]|nr:ABC transporter ATP-binding protein [Treponema sp.]MCL2252014.1 ABC transporter ATP-binding protein [Treponema sp.]
MIGSNVVIEGISKSFGDFEALKNVSLEIKKGEFFSLLGPSGCGKTTLLRIIAGFEHPDKGTLTLDGDNVLTLPPNKRPTNTVFQNYALFPHLTVFENVAFSPRLKGASSAEVKSKVEQYLQLVSLDGHADKKPNQLSGGMKQRVAIARALINEPRVLLLDEPLSALDAKLRQHMLIELDRIHDEIGITFIYVTHDQQEALSVSDRIAIMNQGEVLQIDTPHEIYESPATNFVAKFIGETNLFDGVIKSVEKVKLHDFKDISEYMAEVEIPELGIIKVTDVDEIKVGQTVSFTIRPEKIVITKEKPATNRDDINLLQGTVDEPIYSGFQTKFYVQVKDRTLIRVIKQHANYSDEGPDIRWKDSVYLSWSALDGYIVEVKN